MSKIKYASILRLCAVIFILAGCQTATDSFRNAVGLYTVSLKNTPYQSKVFKYPSGATFDSLLGLLQEQKLYIPIKNKQALKIVAMGFVRATDTTEAGFFLKALTPQKTEVSIACKNPNLLERISEDIFLKLENKLSQ